MRFLQSWIPDGRHVEWTATAGGSGYRWMNRLVAVFRLTTHQFYLSGRALGFDGKYYIATPFRKTRNMHMFVYDPAANTLEERGEIVPGLGGEVRPLAVGLDGRIYGTGTRSCRPPLPARLTVW
jgi:hypothetical protein